MNTAVIGLGSNINPHENIKKAKEILSREHTILAESTLVTTTPIGHIAQDDFVNGAWLVETRLSYDEFKAWLKGLEKKLGRIETSEKFGPRPMDLDILAWNKKIIHSDFFERDFVRNAVLQVLPNIEH